VARERDLTTDLAEEVRAAVAAASPPSPPGARPGPAEDQAFRIPLARAAGHITPAIPPAARLARAKEFLLRALRFLWRDQASFNSLLIQAVDGLADRVQEGLEAEKRARHDLTAWSEGLRAHTERSIEEWRRRTAIQDGRLALLEAAEPAPAPRTTRSAPEGAPPLPAGVYRLFEDRFRGSVEEITERQRSYLLHLRGLPGPVLDVGCGRGELLSLLAAEGIPASGVDVNPISARVCRQEGLQVEEGDGLDALAARPNGSLGAVVALQVVEHLSAEAVFVFLREARRSLAPGGVLIVETINTDSISAWKTFFLDPSHVRPMPPDALRFLAEAAGFVEGQIEYRAPLAPGDRLEEISPNDAKLNRLLFAPQDYALIARVPRES
jgi:SAM-dependent methyltransferase